MKINALFNGFDILFRASSYKKDCYYITHRNKEEVEIEKHIKDIRFRELVESTFKEFRCLSKGHYVVENFKGVDL